MVTPDITKHQGAAYNTQPDSLYIEGKKKEIDRFGNASKFAPEHIGLTEVKVGVTFGLTVIDKVVVFAH